MVFVVFGNSWTGVVIVTFERVRKRARARGNMLYPNPATNYIRLDLVFEIKKGMKIQIHDKIGKLVVEALPEQGVSSCLVELNGIERGNYMVSIVDQKGLIWSDVFVKQ